MLPFSVRGCRRAAGLVFETKMVLDRFWLSRHDVNRDGMATMLIVLASVGWRQSLARFYVIGSNTPAEILELASGDIIRTGYVPDVIGYSRDRRLSVAPLRYDAGVTGKVNMSLAFGLPAFVTSVAAEGMQLVDGEDVLIADDKARCGDETPGVPGYVPLAFYVLGIVLGHGLVSANLSKRNEA